MAGRAVRFFAPMIGSAGCGGVLAVKLRHGLETHPLVRAAIIMIAAQLSTVVTGMPAASAEGLPPAPDRQVRLYSGDCDLLRPPGLPTCSLDSFSGTRAGTASATAR